MNRLIIASSLTLNEHQQMAEYKKHYFSSDVLIPAETTHEWYMFNPYTVVAVRDTDTLKIVGNMNIIPIRNELVSHLSLEQLDDSVFDLAFLKENQNLVRRYDEKGSYIVYLYSVAVHSQYLRTEAFKLLIGAYLEIALRLAREDMFVAVIIGNAASQIGLKLCEYLGMRPVYASARNRIYISMIGERLSDWADKTKVGKFLYNAGQTRLSNQELWELLEHYKNYFSRVT